MTITKSGELASFYTVNKAPIKHLRVYFSPKQAGEGDPSPENVREISGWDNINIYHNGKNYWTNKDISVLSNNKISQLPFALFPNTTYTLSAIVTSSDTDVNQCLCRIEPSRFIHTFLYRSINSDRTFTTFTTNDLYFDTIRFYAGTTAGNSAGDFALFKNIQLELGNVSTEYEPYHGQTYTLDWSDTLGTIYGGYVDLVTGTLTKTWDIITYDGVNNKCIGAYSNSTANLFGGLAPIKIGSTVNNFLCANRKTMYMTNTTDVTDFFTVYAAPVSNNYYLILLCDELSNYEEITNAQKINLTNEMLAENPVIIIYPLKTPVTYQLTSQQFSTLIGQNNIWSNADRVEVEYDLAESNDELYRRRNILLRTPHIETAAGNIANFKTDMQVPLKECKVYFNPVQEGEGMPSPENIRPITGWTNLSVIHTKNNLLFTNPSEWTNAVWGGVNTQTANNSRLCTIKTISIEPNTTYTINIPNFFLGVNIYNSSGNRIYDSGWKENILTFTTSDTASMCGINVRYPNQGQISPDIVGVEMFPQLEVGDVATEYSPRNTFSIDWTNEVGTIYGGYVDLVSGEIWQTWNQVVMSSIYNVWNETLPNTVGGYTTNLSTLGIPNDKISENTKSIGNYLPHGGGYGSDIMGVTLGGNRYIAIRLPYNILNGITYESTATEKKNAMNAYLSEHPLTVIYVLDTPILITTLTLTQLKTLRGTNNIWSNAGDITLSYWKH